MVIYHFGANPLIHQQGLCNLELTLHGPSPKKILYFEWPPPWHLFAIVSDISSGNIYIYVCVLSSSDILFWHSIRHSIWHSILAFYRASILTSYLAFFVASILTFFSGILSGIFFCHMFWHTFWHAIWHSIWHSSLTFYLASILTLFSGILSGISSEILCGWGPALWSGAHGWGPAGLEEEGGGRRRKEAGRLT